MPNYKGKKSWTVKKFTLDVYPYVAPPENIFDHPAIQYGADFKVTFTRAGTPKNKIGLLQLILPRTKLFSQTVVGSWNVDKRMKSASPITLGGALYSEENVPIGVHSELYHGQMSRFHSILQCWLIDTPRELSNSFTSTTFTGETSTKFADYVVELSGKDGALYNPGMVWGYAVTQDRAKLANFDVSILEPKECLLKDNNEHLDAIANFLGKMKIDIKNLVS
jgi:hypothetical protein